MRGKPERKCEQSLSHFCPSSLCCLPPFLQERKALRADLQAQSAKAVAEARVKYNELQVR